MRSVSNALPGFHFCIVPISVLSVATGESFYRQKIFWDVRDELSACEEIVFVGLCSPAGRIGWYGLYVSTEQWFKVPAMPDDGRSHGIPPSSLVCFDEKLFVIGGPSSHQGMSIGTSTLAPSLAVSFFDLKLWQWKSAAPLNIARTFFNTRIVNNELYVCGGCPENSISYTHTVEVYDLSTQTWRLVVSKNISMMAGRDLTIDGRSSYVTDTDCMSFPEFCKTTGVCWILDDLQRDGLVQQLPNKLKIYCNWSPRPVELNGKWYVKCDTNVNGIDPETLILLYNPIEDEWEDFIRFCSRGMLEETPKRVFHWWPGSASTSPPRFGCGMSQQLMAIKGKLCIAQPSHCACRSGSIFDIKDLTGRSMFFEIS